jgi:glycosyltransferase involved in cell wall biosynthesis
MAMKKLVTIDARWLIGGIGTYTENLLHGLAQTNNDLRFRVIARPGDVPALKSLCSQVEIVDVPIYTLREQILIPRAAKTSDLLHVPHFNVPLMHRGPLLASIMDVIHLRSPEYRRSLSSFLYARPMLNLAVRKADHIVTVSRYSKNQIMEELGIPGSKISVIHCAVGAHFRRPAEQKEIQSAVATLGLNRPYLLYVGNLKPHKNVAMLLRAFAHLRHDKQLPHSLLLVGNDVRGRPPILQECARLKITDVVTFAPHLPAGMLPAVYAGADLLVLPSTMEGFGLPVIEAMATGTPVVCSDAASLPEVAGDAALYFDPNSDEQLICQIELVLRSDTLRAWLRQNGLARARQFSGQAFARRHLEIYRNLLGLANGAESVPALTSWQEAL